MRKTMIAPKVILVTVLLLSATAAIYQPALGSTLRERRQERRD